MRPEDEFSRHLDNSLANKQGGDRLAAEAETLARKQQAIESRARAEQQKAVVRSEEDRKNQAALELESQLPIRQYLETIRSKMAPKQKILRRGPKDGKIGYSLIYGSKIKVVDFIELSRGWVGGHSGKGGSDPGRLVIHYLRVPAAVKDVLGVGLSSEGLAYIWNKKVSIGLGYEPSINPLDWKEFSYKRTRKTNNELILEYNDGTAEKGGVNTFFINTEDGLQGFAQTLTDFYVGLKTGKIK